MTPALQAGDGGFDSRVLQLKYCNKEMINIPKKEDLTGQELYLIRFISPAPSKNGKTYWNCECINCGATKIIQTSHVKDGRTKTCGCGCTYNDENSSPIEKECEICKKKFEVKPLGQTRKYCYDCSPSYLNSTERTASIIILRRKMKEQAVQIKGGKCEKCGYNKCIGALQFHHRNPKEKSFGLGQNESIHSWQDYLNEVMKCDLLCANCHAETHYLNN